MRHRFLFGIITLLVGLLIGVQVLHWFSRSEPKPSEDFNIQLQKAFLEGKPSDLASLAIPPLPFADNPDPSLCGIPTPYGTRDNTAWLSGMYQGELVQPIVYLYRDHLREEVTAIAPHGTMVEVLLFQANPQLNYYMVRIPSAPEGQREGWVPEPFLSFTPIETSTN